MYTGTVKCYSSSLVLARSQARKTGTTTGLFLLCYVHGGLVLGPGALPSSHNILKGKILAQAQVIGVKQFT